MSNIGFRFNCNSYRSGTKEAFNIHTPTGVNNTGVVNMGNDFNAIRDPNFKVQDDEDPNEGELGLEGNSNKIKQKSKGLSVQTAQPLQLDKKITLDSKTMLHVYHECSQNYLSGVQTFNFGSSDYIKGPGTLAIPSGKFLAGGGFDDLTCSIKVKKIKFNTPQGSNTAFKRSVLQYNKYLKEEQDK